VLDELLAEAREDDNVLGLVVFGSRGKGAYVDERSDWDVFVVVREQRGERPFRHGAQLETVEVTPDQLRNQPQWMRYALAWLEPQLDKTGEVAEALRDAVRVDPASAGEPLDGYINLLYRSLKNARIGLAFASLLDAQESIGWFLEFLFAVHGRLRPYNKWLEWELEQHPLPGARTTVVRARLERIARTGDVSEQQALFREAERLAREHGLDAVVDGWEPDVAWFRGA
jgi:Nucleotidyltransferase domain